MLNDFLKQVVVNRWNIGIRKWASRLREDSSSRPYAWLRPDFVPPSPFLVVKDPQTQSSRILVEPHLTDAEFRKAWMNFFCRPGHLAVTPDEFLDFVGHILPQEPYLDLPRITKRNVWGTCPTPRLPYQRDRLLSLCGCCARPRGRAGVGAVTVDCSISARRRCSPQGQVLALGWWHRLRTF